jgi:hypothetical protein
MRDAHGQPIAYIYYESESGRRRRRWSEYASYVPALGLATQCRLLDLLWFWQSLKLAYWQLSGPFAAIGLYEARRIAAIIAKLPELLRKPQRTSDLYDSQSSGS